MKSDQEVYDHYVAYCKLIGHKAPSFTRWSMFFRDIPQSTEAPTFKKSMYVTETNNISKQEYYVDIPDDALLIDVDKCAPVWEISAEGESD